MKAEGVISPIKANIDTFSGKRVILSGDINHIKLEANHDVSIKFNVGTEVYFLKTTIKTYLNRYYFDISTKVTHFKRRKDKRFLIPKKWAQTSCLVLSPVKYDTVKCTVLDISLTGIRLQITKSQQKLNYQPNDIIKVRFQIYKRAEIETQGIIRFLSNKPELPIIVGVEFNKLTHIHKQRIANIIEDIGLHKTAHRTKNS